jgi:hypothetical protein
MTKKKKIFNIHGHKGSANENDIVILPYSSKNGGHQEDKQ